MPSTSRGCSTAGVLAFALALFASMTLCADSYWKCKDGTGSSVVSDSGSSRRDGVIDGSGKCVWAREDDRGFFLTFRNGGSVLIPKTEDVEFPKGFDMEIFFSCDFDAICAYELQVCIDMALEQSKPIILELS